MQSDSVLCWLQESWLLVTAARLSIHISGIPVRYGATMLKTIDRPLPSLAEKRITREIYGRWERSRLCKKKNALLNIPPERYCKGMRQETPTSHWHYTWSIRSSAFLIVTLKKCLLCPLFSTSSIFPIRRGKENLMKKCLFADEWRQKRR
jgi:hypothetical protein